MPHRFPPLFGGREGGQGGELVNANMAFRRNKKKLAQKLVEKKRNALIQHQPGSKPREHGASATVPDPVLRGALREKGLTPVKIPYLQKAEQQHRP